jgi:cation diffusion facilitator CzcD-associated flavoprotein CzcO
MTSGPASEDAATDVVIVGAGLAGLTAARKLDAAGAPRLRAATNPVLGFHHRHRDNRSVEHTSSR